MAREEQPGGGTTGSAPRVAHVEERKVVTVLFCDLADFTQQSDGADPEDIKARLDPYHDLVRSQLERFGGTFEKFAGDAVIGVFGAPIAHEDDAERAVYAGLRIVEAIDVLNETEPGLGLRVRVGIDTGLALVSVQARPEAGESFVKGDVVNTAARLQTVAPVGGVGVGARTHDATRHVFDFEPLPAVTLKGKREPVALYRARRRSRGGDATRAYAGPFVGREVERALLRAICARSIRDSTFQLVTVCGEPGIGKSRLVGDLFSHLDEDPDVLVKWRRGRCLAYGEGITFWALGEIVKAEAGIDPADDPDAVRSKLDKVLPPEDEAGRDWLRQRLMPLVGLGVEAPSDREESFTAWQRFLEHVAEVRPTVLVFEDLHWADAALLAFLDHLMRHAAPVPLTVVATARPELFERDPLFGAGVRNASRVDLAPLDERETAALVTGLLHGGELPEDVLRLIADQSGGIPLFAEEFVRLLTERNLLSRDGQTWRLADQDVPLPTGISSLIAARLDALPADRKALLANAAVIGETFWSSAVASMSGVGRDDVERAFQEISRMELVRRSRASTMAAETEYRFWHALVRDVAYGQIPRAVRADKHLAAAAWVERAAADRVEDVSEILAEHLTEAIDLLTAAHRTERAATLVDRAIRYLTLAGDRAMALNGNRAEAHFRRALALAPPEHPERPGLVARLAEAVHVTGHLPEAARLYEEALAALEARGDPGATADLIVRYVVVLGTLGQSVRALELLDRAIGDLEPDGPSPELARAYAERAYPGWNASAGEAIGKAESALDLADRLDLPAVRARALDFRGGSRVALGDPGGLEDLRAALRLSRELGLTRQTYVTYFNLVGNLCYEDPTDALDVADEGLRFVGDRGLAEGEAWLRAFRLQALWQLGEWTELIRAAEDVRAWAGERGHEWVAATAAYPEAFVLAVTGRSEEAARLSARVEDAARRLGMKALFDIPVIARLRSAGRDDEAAERIEATVAAFEADRNGFLELSTELVRQAVELGRLDLVPRIERLLAGELAIARHGRSTSAGLLAEAAARYDDALASFAAAEAGWTSFGNPYEQGHALLGQARCLSALGRTEDASERARAAIEAFELVGAAGAARQAVSLFARR